MVLLLVATACTPGGDAISLDAVADNDRGVALMGRYEYAAAEEVFAAVAAREPAWLDARVNLAIATLNRQQDGDEQLALDILADVVAEDENQARALYTSAILHLYLGDAERATALLRHVTALDATDAYAAYFLGQSLLQQGDYAAAAEWFLASLGLDAYLRSAYWAGSQALRRVGRDEDAMRLLDDYQRFETNPAARLAGFSYARMGPKASALAISPATPPAAPRPAGALFGHGVAIADTFVGTAISTADINGDGLQDLVATGNTAPAVFIGAGDGTFARATEHPLASAGVLNALLWGDVDDDGLVDAVLCGSARAHYWRQTDAGTWTAAAALEQPCDAGALADADHDGDLDILLTGPAGFELFSNNRDGSFRRLADERGLKGGAGKQLLVVDLDGDRDLDIVVVNDEPPHDIWQNDLTWAYTPLAGLDDLKRTPLRALTVADADADGHRELYGLTPDGMRRWRYDGIDWTEERLGDGLPASASALDVADFDGDQRPEILIAAGDGFTVIDPRSGAVRAARSVVGMTAAIAVTLAPEAGPALAVAAASGISVVPPGPGRFGFLSVALTGRSEAQQMRSNASGIGTLMRVRAAGRWAVFDAIDAHSGPGQSLAPLAVGLGGHDQADFVALDWTDGVTQTELDLAVGEHHVIEETERQLASCPVFFAWDGNAFAFVGDVLGGAALGYLDVPAPGVGASSYAPPRPVESYLLDAGSLAVRNGRYQIKLAEPMEENVYLDAAQLTVVDLPPGWDMVLDERLAVGGAPATGEPITFRDARLPSKVTTASGADVTPLATARDRRAPPPGKLDRRFIGLLARNQVLTLQFDAPLPANAVLVADGWIEYPYSQTVFAAWQAGLRYRAPTLEARAGNGAWQTVQVEFGYPAGMPRTMAFRLPELPPDTDALRLGSNMEIYWDRLRVVQEQPLDKAVVTTLTPTLARVARTGFAKRTTGPQRLPHYDYGERSTYWDAKVPRGFYTALGDATVLTNAVDGALAIIGSGEEIHLEFPAVPDPGPGVTRRFAVRFHGWAKDMDLYTRHGQTVGPLPMLDDADERLLAARDALHARYNVRFQEGL